MKLLLVLFALLTGFGGADAPVMRSAAPTAMGAVVLAAQKVAGQATASVGMRFEQPLPSLREMADCPDVPVTLALADLTRPARGDRTRE